LTHILAGLFLNKLTGIHIREVLKTKLGIPDQLYKSHFCTIPIVDQLYAARKNECILYKVFWSPSSDFWHGDFDHNLAYLSSSKNCFVIDNARARIIIQGKPENSEESRHSS
jgi:hypothetical protein